MQFIYATDLHGNEHKYRVLMDYALRLDIKLIHLGSDILPKGPGLLKIQKIFIKGFLRDYYKQAKDKGINLLAFFGNDDLYSRKKYFREFSTLLDENPYQIERYTFTAYGYVPDYIFGLKTACKLDYRGWSCPEEYIGQPVEVGNHGFEEITDIPQYFAKKSTIEEDLRNFPGGENTIAAIHTPPYDSELDTVKRSSGANLKVGSKSIRNWIEETQPRIVLSGHIHECPQTTGIWKRTIGNTLVVQPGQNEKETVFVILDIQPQDIVLERFVVPA